MLTDVFDTNRYAVIWYTDLDNGPFTWTRIRAHGRCDRSTGDAYSSMAPDPTSDLFRGPSVPILWFVFPTELMKLFTVRYFCHFLSQVVNPSLTCKEK
jgi:hypothetical protein